MLQEEPDAAKLRKKIVELQVELASQRRAMKESPRSVMSIKGASKCTQT
jgi:hypothetical protein